MATTALTKEAALALVTKAKHNAKARAEKAEEGIAPDALVIRKKFFGLWTDYTCAMHGDKHIATTFRDYCYVCHTNESIASRANSAYDDFCQWEKLALEAKDGGDVTFDADEIVLLRRWAPRDGE